MIAMNDKPKVIRETDAAAIRLAKTLIRTARFGALAVLEPQSGDPLVSRVGVATDLDGTPLILVSMLSAHTQALISDPRCSLLLGEPGKGDPLAHPRISLACRAAKVGRDGVDGPRIKRRYLARNPKAELYVDLGDFHFFALSIERASLNGGFGRAYLLKRDDIRTADAPGLDQVEMSAVEHMNADHADAIRLYAGHHGKLAGDGWKITGLDAEGMDLANGEKVGRVWFEQPLSTGEELRPKLVEMARVARSENKRA
jgi:putative heme iron utilization protein